MAAMHKATCTRPGCGLACSSASVDEVMAWSEAHDQHCPSLQAQEIAPRLLAAAETRGAVKLLDYLMRQHADSMAIVQLDLAGLWDRLVAGEVTL